MDFLGMYRELRAKHGPQKWWPQRTKECFEICAGAILAQNTAWRNVEKALDNLIAGDAISPERIAAMHERKLRRIIRSSGSFGDFSKRITREELLGVKGIGRETADCILLYACGKPFFVIDAYTRRLLSARGAIMGESITTTSACFSSLRCREACGFTGNITASSCRKGRRCGKALIP